MVAALLFAAMFANGCSLWDAERWNINRLRDERAAEIEGNLSREKPIVANPL
jgi:hypothetical protein